MWPLKPRALDRLGVHVVNAIVGAIRTDKLHWVILHFDVNMHIHRHTVICHCASAPGLPCHERAIQYGQAKVKVWGRNEKRRFRKRRVGKQQFGTLSLKRYPYVSCFKQCLRHVYVMLVSSSGLQMAACPTTFARGVEALILTVLNPFSFLET